MPLSLKIPGYPEVAKLESQDATILIGWYTFFTHFLAAFYFLDVYRGSSSDWVISPIFEYSKDAMMTMAISLAIYSFIYMFVASLGLIRGVKAETRIYYFPWFILTSIEIILLLYRVFHLIWRYSYDSNVILMSVLLLMFVVYQIYLYIVVLSNYRHLKRIQNPTLIFPPDM